MRDAHAEVLARRGLVAFLQADVARVVSGESGQLVERVDGTEPGVRRGVRLHFYCSAAPCGDTAIYDQLDGTTAYTGAKLGDWSLDTQRRHHSLSYRCFCCFSEEEGPWGLWRVAW